MSQARVSPSLLGDSEALLPILAAYRFIEQVARREHLEDLGVVIGQRASAFDLGEYGAVLQQAPTVYEYLQIGIRLIGGHSSGTRFWLQAEGDVLRVNQFLSGPPGLGRCIGDLYTLVITISMLRRIIGPAWSPGEVRLMAGDEALLGKHDVFGDTPLISGQRHSSFTIARSLMQFPLPAGSTSSVHKPSGAPMPVDFKTSIEQLISSLSIDGFPSIEVAAEAAGMGSRTLQRRLAELGMTFTGLVSASRLRLAQTWLTESEMPIGEIAATLGYRETTNFIRAFRRLTGISPGAFRRDRAQRKQTV
ncbi:MAG: helix-turn-helix domain-containing protein [Gammaproteobacteria bacterium]|nr:helix-turn-helix domain-containing protein [Gammaproteobacteria bacterium]